MAELIPTYTRTQFKKLTDTQVRRLKCCEITDSYHNYLFTFTNPRTPYVRKATENLGMLSNQVGGEFLEDITQKEEVAV